MRVRPLSAIVNPLLRALSSSIAELAHTSTAAYFLLFVVLLVGTACISRAPAQTLDPEDGSLPSVLPGEPGTDAPYNFQALTVTTGIFSSDATRQTLDPKDGPSPTVLFTEPGTDGTHKFQAFTVTIGKFSSDATQKNTGSRSIKLNTGAAPGTASYVQKDSLVGNSARISTYVRFASFPDSDSTILKVGNPKGDGVFSVAVTPTGYLELLNWEVRDVVPLGPTGIHQLKVGVWYRLSLVYDFTDAAHYTAKVFVNGVEDVSVTNSPTLFTVDPSLVRWGWVWTASEFGVNKVLNIDDIYVDDSNSGTDTWDIRITTKAP